MTEAEHLIIFSSEHELALPSPQYPVPSTQQRLSGNLYKIVHSIPSERVTIK